MVAREAMLRADVIAVRGLAALLTAWVNDVYSFPKEAACSDPLNLVLVLGAERALGTERALARAVELYNADLSELERLIEAIRADSPSPPLLGYLEGLVTWVHGNRIWTRLCGRYL